MEENDRLQKQVSQLVYENSYFRQQSQNVELFFKFLNFSFFHFHFFWHILAISSWGIYIYFKTWGLLASNFTWCCRHLNYAFLSNLEPLMIFLTFGHFSWLQPTLATTDNSCESVVTSGQPHLTPQHTPRDASPAGLVKQRMFIFPLCCQLLLLASYIHIYEKS